MLCLVHRSGNDFSAGEQKLSDFSVGEAKIGEKQSRQSRSKYNFMQYEAGGIFDNFCVKSNLL